MSKKSWIVCSIVFIVIIWIIASNSNIFENKQEKKVLVSSSQSNIDETKTDSKVDRFAERFGAITDWNRQSGNSYSYRIQSKLNNRPLLFEGYVEDVYTKNSKYYIRLSSFSSYDDYILEVECTKDMVNEILESNSRRWAMVANVKSISKPVFGIVSDNGEIDEDSYTAITVEQVDETYIIKGVCVDILEQSDFIS